MKTHSGSFWLDLGDRLSLLFGAWGSLIGIAMAFQSAEVGSLGLFLLWGWVACIFGWVFAIDATGQLNRAAKHAAADYRIEELRAESAQLKAEMLANGASR